MGEIQQRRALLGGFLLYDVLLQCGSIREADLMYPPLDSATILVDAYWCLDSENNVAYAVSSLSDCRLNTDYASEIQATASAPNTDPYPSYPPLIVKYDLDTYIIALASSNTNSLFDAWQFQRTFSEEDPTRTRLLKKLLQWCVTRAFDFSFKTFFFCPPHS
ncbi:hypothetical protein K435DRAFT_824590 [Dendrothele bispora CBS 962.96]|uniref:ELYS-like domain-containing protein n=1 Tax=Dendrothele bispora (strain CBS 962.96) TaxID=1314807 RepID=A0A4S8KLB5_DENBC|nr:hypothetical protein K435DRAFT_824590 [Dendrothele bispora CBS 962.96]